VIIASSSAPLRAAALTVILAVAIGGCRLRDESEAGAPIPAPPDVAAPPADALRTSSGLASKVLHIGFAQARPSRRSFVTVNYTGWTTDGRMFETNRGIEFQLDQVIPGWTEGLQLMVVGEKRRFWIPANLAYEGMPDRPQGMLVFDIELLNVR
jgi:peptidylprolyl isomerase